MKKTRATYKGSTEAIADALFPCVTTTSFVKYVDDPKEPTNKHAIRRHCGILRALHAIWSPLTFTRRKMQSALTIVGRRRGWFADTPGLMLEWSGVCANRIRALCRHFSQAQLKARGSMTSWVRLILHDADEACLRLQISCYKSIN